MKLVIAEKEAIRNAIAIALGDTRIEMSSKIDPIYYEDYVITNLQGHAFELKEPEDYDEKYKKWDLSELPIFFDNWGIKPKESQQYKIDMIGKLLQKADTVIHAGDPDEEGQLLVDEVLDWFKYKGKVLRVDTSVLEKKTLQKKLNEMCPNEEKRPMGQSAYARSVADMIVGINMSRYFTLIANSKTLSVGRVQTPTLGLVIKRDEAIENHTKTKYFVVVGNVEINNEIVPFEVQLPKNDPRLTEGKLLNNNEAEIIRDYIADKVISGIEIKKHNETIQPPLPFNLAKLQTYCANKFGYSLDDVMKATQNLKDNYTCISYNRSDCQYLSSEHFEQAPETLRVVCQNINFTPKELNPKIKSKAFDDDKISAHHGIIPTGASVDINAMPEKERNIYLAICKYYLAQFLPPASRLRTSLKKETKVGIISASSSVITNQGYKVIFKDEEPEEHSGLSNIPEGIYEGETDECEILEKETRPPSRYTEASLNEDMTCISKYVDDPEIKGLLLAKDAGKEGENGSIGTSATRGTIIATLIKRGYLEEDSKMKIKSTPLGREFYKMLPDELKKPDMTAKWWVMQEAITKKEIPVMDLPMSVLDTCKKIMDRKFDTSSVPSNAKKESGGIVGKCPLCGNNVFFTKKGGVVCKGFFDKTCSLSLYPEYAFKKLSPDTFRELINEGETKEAVKGLKIKGKMHKKLLYLDKEGKIQTK